MRIFDTDVQKLKYDILREVARYAYEDRLLDGLTEIPKIIAPGPKPTMRCCIYKERAIVSERLKLAMGGDKDNPNTIEVIGIACDECPVSTYQVTDACRGCLAHRCAAACPRGAISFDEHQKAHIDPDKCVECGRCAEACQYSAISNHKRPCEKACKVKAITEGENHVAHIDESKCIECGACVYQCPFGAISEKSYILDAIRILRESENGKNYKVYAVVAPSISSQFRYAKLGQVITALKRLGFYNVVEAALGADMVAWSEAQELAEKGFLTSSCCPAFVSYIHKQFPKLVDKISHNLSPMAMIAKYLKESEPGSKVIFIGPCTAKKGEAQKDSVKPWVDCVMTFQELQASWRRATWTTHRISGAFSPARAACPTRCRKRSRSRALISPSSPRCATASSNAAWRCSRPAAARCRRTLSRAWPASAAASAARVASPTARRTSPRSINTAWKPSKKRFRTPSRCFEIHPHSISTAKEIKP